MRFYIGTWNVNGIRRATRPFQEWIAVASGWSLSRKSPLLIRFPPLLCDGGSCFYWHGHKGYVGVGLPSAGIAPNAHFFPTAASTYENASSLAEVAVITVASLRSRRRQGLPAKMAFSCSRWNGTRPRCATPAGLVLCGDLTSPHRSRRASERRKPRAIGHLPARAICSAHDRRGLVDVAALSSHNDVCSPGGLPRTCASEHRWRSTTFSPAVPRRTFLSFPVLKEVGPAIMRQSGDFQMCSNSRVLDRFLATFATTPIERGSQTYRTPGPTAPAARSARELR